MFQIGAPAVGASWGVVVHANFREAFHENAAESMEHFQILHLKQLAEARGQFEGLSAGIATFLKKEKMVKKLMCCSEAALKAQGVSLGIEADSDMDQKFAEWLNSDNVKAMHAVLQEQVAAFRKAAEMEMSDHMAPVLEKCLDIYKGKAGGASWCEGVKGDALQPYLHAAKTTLMQATFANELRVAATELNNDCHQRMLRAPQRVLTV